MGGGHDIVARKMSAVTSYTRAITSDQAQLLKGLLAGRGYEFVEKPYCLFAVKRPGLSVAVYEKGPKVLVQGKGTEDFVKHLLEPEVLGVAEMGYEEVLHPEKFERHIGVDESGKGDFFGPLVIAGAYVDEKVASKLAALGVMDSKRIGTDAKIAKIADGLRRLPGLKYEVIQINPQRYNEMYVQFKNLNRLLAWGHAKVIENLLERVPDCPRALSDQFANPTVLQRALKERGRAIELVQRTKAESDPAVAAASILARDAFVKWMAQAGAEQGFETGLPKGASAAVKDAAKEIIATSGREALSGVAKMHFKTASEVLGSLPGY